MTRLRRRIGDRSGVQFTRLTFRGRIVAFISGLIATVALFIFLVFPAAIERQAMSTLQREAETTSRIVAHSVASGLVFEDRASVEESLEAVLENEDVLHIEVRDNEDNVFAALSAFGVSSPVAKEEHEDWEFSQRIHFTGAPVNFNGEVFGVVHLDISHAQVAAAVGSARRAITVVSLCVFLLGLLVAWLIGSRIVAPLAGVAATAERIADGDLDRRAQSPTDDEVGQLARSFNRMVDRLQVTQEHLLQSQKMESIGQLAGGIAHDFNNLLTTILGNAEFLLMDLPAGHVGRDDVLEIQVAGERAASLTGQLLAFSRRQVTDPRTLSLNAVLSGVEKMLARVLGESLLLDTEIEPDLMSIVADPGNLEQVIVNLAVNARDAMSGGGTLSIRTRNVSLAEAQLGRRGDEIPAGRYAVLSVSDEGTGMDDDTLSRIFEPFFTRKGPGEGTGLGLSTVYGIVRQSKGFIQVESRVGHGTSFTLYFPEAEDPAEMIVPSSLHLTLPTGTETILVAEDQNDVRKLTRKSLERLGYRVLTASDAEEALHITRTQTETIDLLLTDVVMPGMSGPLLGEEMASLSPETSVIYMSGYTDDQLVHHGVLEEGIVLIEKPFTTSTIASTVRAVLDRSHSTSQLAHTG